MANHTKTVKMQQIVGIVNRVVNGERRSYWTRIGTAFENRDGSWNEKFDFYPAHPDITVQMRPIDPKEDASHEQPAEAAADVPEFPA